mgnify:CR=1 FL=1
MEHVLLNEGYFADQLRTMGDAHPSIREVRGTGYFSAVALCADSAADRHLSAPPEAAPPGCVLGRFCRRAPPPLPPAHLSPPWAQSS